MAPNLVADNSSASASLSSAVLPEAPQERSAPSQREVFRSLIHLAREVVHGPAEDRWSSAIALQLHSPSLGVFLKDVLEQLPSKSREDQRGMLEELADSAASGRDTADGVVIPGFNDRDAPSLFAQAIAATNPGERREGLISLLMREYDDLHVIALGVIAGDPDITIAASAVGALSRACSDDELVNGLNREIVQRLAASAPPLD